LFTTHITIARHFEEALHMRGLAVATSGTFKIIHRKIRRDFLLILSVVLSVSKLG